MNVESGTPEGFPAQEPGESVYVETNGVRLHTVQAGPEDGPLVVLLHGFPEFWYSWHDQLRPLANAGYRVVVPDQRGYNLSDKPKSIGAYDLDTLARDVVGLIDETGAEKAYLVGHDWGAMVAWWVALHYPDRVEKLCTINVPHPHVLGRSLRRHWDQKLRSWYVVFFQLPLLPELVSRFHGWDMLVRTMRRTSLPGTFTVADFERYREAWSQPGAFRSMLNWYRAMVRSRPRPKEMRVTVPTLVVWGARDKFLRKSMARESVNLCDDGRLMLCEDATHWVHHEEPVRVSDALVEFFDE